MVLFLLFRFVFFLGYVPTSSMEPAISEGSLILGLRIHDEPEKGDIVVFRRDGKYLVKRIAAVPGDTVERDGETETVPEDHWYLLGDNSKESYDARYWEDPFVPTEDIKAVVLLPAA